MVPAGNEDRKQTQRDAAMLFQNVNYGLTAEEPLVCGVVRHPSRTPLSAETHNAFELGVVLRGAYEWLVDDHQFAMRPGDVWLSAAWEPHRWRITVPDTELLVFMFLPEFLPDGALAGRSWLSFFSPPPDERPRVTAKETAERVLAIARDLAGEIEGQRTGWQVSIRLNLLRLLWEISREWNPGPRAEAYAARAGNLSRLLPAINLVYGDPARTLALSEAAAACGLSRSQFTEAFRHTLGMGFHKFKMRVRLWNVARLLVTTGMSISAIAEHTGFVDDSHLHRVFAKVYACTPAQYRARAPHHVRPAA